MTVPPTSQNIVFFDILRSLAFGGISGSFADVGGPLLYRGRMICFTNHTQGDVVFTNDGVNDKVFVAAGSFKLWDLQANMNVNKDDKYVLPIGTQWQVRQLTAPVSGAVYIEIIY